MFVKCAKLNLTKKPESLWFCHVITHSVTNASYKLGISMDTFVALLIIKNVSCIRIKFKLINSC
jgi:hypothetical protein